jgi:hypothetical protein
MALNDAELMSPVFTLCGGALPACRKLPRSVNRVVLDSSAENGRGNEEIEVHGIADRGDTEGRRSRRFGWGSLA